MDGLKTLKPINRSKGFTLVEVIISVAVLCIVCGIILRLFVSADELREKNIDIEKAQVAVLNEMERLKSADEPYRFNILSEPDYDGEFPMNKYFDKDWNFVNSWENPRFILSTTIKPIGSGMFTEGSFGKQEKGNGISSALFEISIKMSEIEGRKVLASVESTHYYRNMGVRND